MSDLTPALSNVRPDPSSLRYEPYGYVASGATPTIGFTGHVNDADTGLTYMQQRYYDPVAGRFLSVDPVVTDANTAGSLIATTMLRTILIAISIQMGASRGQLIRMLRVRW